MRIVTAFVFMVAYVSVVYGKPVENANSFICAVDKTVGFGYAEAKSEWSSFSQGQSERKHLFKQDENGDWSVSQLGYEGIVHECAEGFNENGLLSCGDNVWSFLINRKTLRYQEYSSGTYVIFRKEEDWLSPYIHIGKCQVLQYAKGPWDKYE